MDTESRRPTHAVTAPAPDAGGAAPDDVYRRLWREGHRFQFRQALRLLERAFPEAPPIGETADYLDPPIRLRPSVDLVFPATDLKRVARPDERPEAVEVVSTFLGLYGIDSPLPYRFYEHLAHGTSDTIPFRDFLDIFNHRLYAFFYRAWKKYRPWLHYRAGGRDRHSRRMVALAGLGTPGAMETTGALEAVAASRMRLAAQAGTLGPRVRNADGLEALLRAFLEDVEVEVIENVPRWVDIPSPGGLGDGGVQLGENATVGEQIYDRAGKFRIRLGPLSLDQYRSFLPGGDRAEALHELVRLYAPDYLAYDVQLHVPSADLPTLEIGGDESRLGYTTSLGTPRQPLMSRIVEYE
jgi:type VI secretion system protein ImpH